jgi:hypothetical protein
VWDGCELRVGIGREIDRGVRALYIFTFPGGFLKCGMADR